MNKSLVLGVLLLLTLTVIPIVGATNDCNFTDTGSSMILLGDCTTDETIMVPDGYTLDGLGFTITAVDPPGGHFVGAVVQNEIVPDGFATVHVTNLTVAASGLANVCDSRADRLRGIMFEGASGSITRNTVVGINQGASGCQEGNAIEVRNAPFDGTHPDTQIVDVSHNTLSDWQKTGIVANGDVDVRIQHNRIGASATQENLAANSIQVGFGAIGNVQHNNLDGNQWLGASNFAATAVLIFSADSSVVSNNNIRGNSDVGLFINRSNNTVDNNRIFDDGLDGPHGDVGIVVLDINNELTNNKIRGFDTPILGADTGTNKLIPSPQTQ